MSGEITLEARAKLNLYLDITGLRADGYHLIETVMQSISLADIVHIRLYECGRGITVSCSDRALPRDEDNLAGKAARLYMDEIGECAGADIHIEKRIPSGAGMGGGSADAAAVLFGLNRLYGRLSEERLAALALKCGADVPFCLFGGTKLCRGIGEVMEDLPPIGECFFLVVMPDFTCPTGEAYRKWDASPLPVRGKLSDFLEEGIACPENMHNVFEVLYNDPRIEQIRRRLLIEGGAKGVRLTGSGAAIFGIFSDRESAQKAAGLFPERFTAVCAPESSGIAVL
ncbi:MAG: 4-(cytidine 5'-diphospho)-2-C-methyl-D-erythritol kinase [Oscillospiraceae bacterium]